MKLYTYFRSSAAFRVRIALNLKGLDCEQEFVHLPKGQHRSPEYVALSRHGLVPTLAAGDHLLTQSLAIIEYLDETHPQPPLLPKEAAARARVRGLSLLVACEIHPLNNLRTLNYLRKSLAQSEEQVAEWYRHWIADGLVKLEAELAESPGTSRFCHGDMPTMADCCLVPQIFNARRYKSDLQPYPTVMRIFEACMQVEAFDLAQPSRQPDAE